MKAPEEHMAPKVPVVTTSTSLVAFSMPSLSTTLDDLLGGHDHRVALLDLLR